MRTSNTPENCYADIKITKENFKYTRELLRWHKNNMQIRFIILSLKMIKIMKITTKRNCLSGKFPLESYFCNVVDSHFMAKEFLKANISPLSIFKNVLFRVAKCKKLTQWRFHCCLLHPNDEQNTAQKSELCF